MREIADAVGVGDLPGQPEQEAQLHHQADLTLIVLVHVGGNRMPLRLCELHVVVHEHPLPRHLHLVEVQHRVVLVERRRERAVEHGERMGFERLAREDLQPFRIQRHHGGDAVFFLARLQRLNRSDEHFVGQRAAGAEHLGAAKRDALAVFVAHAGHQEIVRLLARAPAAVRLRADDDVGEIEIVVSRVFVVLAYGGGARRAVPLEEVEAHEHAGDA